MSRRQWGSARTTVSDHCGRTRSIAPANRPMGLGLAPVEVLPFARTSRPRSRPVQLSDRSVPGIAGQSFLSIRPVSSQEPTTRGRLRRPAHADDADRVRQVRPGVLSPHQQGFTVRRGLTAAECFREIEAIRSGQVFQDPATRRRRRVSPESSRRDCDSRRSRRGRGAPPSGGSRRSRRRRSRDPHGPAS